MKKYIIYTVLFAIIVSNIYIFVSGINLSNEISKYEKDIMILHKENIELEKISTGDVSFQKAASLAAELDFTKKAIPIYLNNLAVALNK